MTQDLRRFLDTIEARRPELVLRVKQEVSAKWELSVIQKRLEADGKLPIIIFEKVAGYAMPVVVNLFASKEHLALALDTTADQVVTRFAEAQKKRFPS